MSEAGRRDFNFSGHAFRVEAPDDAMRWLQHFMEPQFVVKGADDPCETVRLVVDADRHARASASGPHPDDLHRPCFTLDSGIVTGRVWQAGDGGEVVSDEARDVFYRRPPDEPGVVEIIASSDTAAARVALMRAIREYAMLYASRAGGLMLHAAAVCLGDEAFVIAGPKKAGKTTLLLHALRNERGTYVSNDRVALYLGPSGPVVHGIPTIVSIRRESTAWFPDLDLKLHGVRYDDDPNVVAREAPPRPTPLTAWSLSPWQLCDIIGAPSRAAAPAGALLYPEVDPSVQGVTFEPLGREAACRALHGALFRSCPTDGIFRMRDGFVTDAEAAIGARAARVLAELPSVLCRLGPDAYRDGRRWLAGARHVAAQTSRG